MDENLKTVLSKYDELAKLILEQKIDELSDKINELPPDSQDYSYEAYIQRVVMKETEEQTGLMEEEPQEDLGGLSMREYFSKQSLFDNIDIMNYCAVTLDRNVPSSLIAAIAGNENKDEIRRYAEDMINNAAWSEDEMTDKNDVFEISFSKVKACFSLLVEMNDSSFIQPVLDRFMSYDQTRDFVADAIAEYIGSFPEISVPLLIDTIKNHEADGLTGPCEDLVIILAEMGKDNKSDEIYYALKSAFRAMKNKLYATICLGNYGDGRAVPLLKGYINRNQGKIDRDLFYEILSAIQALGGDTSDINDPFGDFEKKLKKE